VVLDDPYRNEQGGCDLLLGLTVGKEVENFLLAISQASQMCSRLLRTRAGIHRIFKLSHGPVNDKSCRSDSAKISKSGQGLSREGLIIGCH
jgi:hypothetical protein